MQCRAGMVAITKWTTLLNCFHLQINTRLLFLITKYNINMYYTANSYIVAIATHYTSYQL